MNKIEQLTSERFLFILKKYLLVVLILDLITRFGVIKLLRLFQKYYSPVTGENLDNLSTIFIASANTFFYLIVGIILFFDLDRRKSMTWIILILTIFNPWMSIIFMLIWKVVEMNNYA